MASRTVQRFRPELVIRRFGRSGLRDSPSVKLDEASQDFTQEVHPKVLLKAEAYGPHGLAFTQGLESAVVQLKQPEDVVVVITTTTSEEWSFGGGRGN